MKRRRPHLVPLSTQVTTLFEQLWELMGTGKYCFPSFRSPRRPMFENTVNAALRAIGFGQEEMTAHGFRAMAATLLHEPRKFILAASHPQLSHMETNALRPAHTRGAHSEQRVR